MRFATLFLLVSGIVVSKSYGLETKISQSQGIQVELHDSQSSGVSKPIRVKDVDSGKVAQINVNKTGRGDLWSGFFVIQFFRGDTKPRVLEFSEPGKDPYYAYGSIEQSIQKISLFKAADDMSKFMTAVLEQQQKDQEKKMQAATSKAQVVSPQSMQKLEQSVRQQTQIQEQAQMGLEEDQSKKRMEMIESMQKLSKIEQEKRALQAKNLAKEGDDLYAAQKYADANKKYAQAAGLAPDYDGYYYKYGVTLYKLESYNKSVAILSLADAPEGHELEKDYYIALNHLKLKDYDKAQKELVEIRDEKDPELSPVAAFFAGTIQMQKQNFPEARKSMEYVLDNSKDPALDRSAESTLEQIDRLENYFQSKKEKFRFTFFGGLVYDQNVLNVANNSSATDVQAYRANYGASVLGIWHRSPDSDLGTSLGFSDYYSTNTRFQGDATLQTADPLEFDLQVPYHQDFTMAKRPANLELSPYYKSIYMSPTGGTRKEVIRSVGVSSTLTSLLRSDFFLAGRLDYASNNSYLDTSSDDDNQTGPQYGLTLIPTKILDLKGEKSVSGELGYSINQTQGINYRYKRLGLAATYSFPAFWASNGSLRADYYTQNYWQTSSPRTDTTKALTLSAAKDLKKNLNLNLSIQYNDSDSPLDSYKYNKFVVTSLLTYTTSLFSQ